MNKLFVFAILLTLSSPAIACNDGDEAGHGAGVVDPDATETVTTVDDGTRPDDPTTPPDDVEGTMDDGVDDSVTNGGSQGSDDSQADGPELGGNGGDE